MATYVLFFFFNDTHPSVFFFFFFNDTATTEIYTLSLHDALPISLILGAGDIAELAAACLVSEGVRVTLVANRTYERAKAIAEELGARALTLDEAWDHFGDCDIVLCSTAAPHAVVTWDRVAATIRRRGGRPLCILDLAVPRDVEPAVAQLENVFLYDLDDLQAVAAHAAAERRNDIPAAERIVTEGGGGLWGGDRRQGGGA